MVSSDREIIEACDILRNPRRWTHSPSDDALNRLTLALRGIGSDRSSLASISRITSFSVRSPSASSIIALTSSNVGEGSGDCEFLSAFLRMAASCFGLLQFLQPLRSLVIHPRRVQMLMFISSSSRLNLTLHRVPTVILSGTLCTSHYRKSSPARQAYPN